VKNQTFTVKMDATTAKKLAALAEGTELSRGAVVRACLSGRPPMIRTNRRG